jgi:hypothetical protein
VHWLTKTKVSKKKIVGRQQQRYFKTDIWTIILEPVIMRTFKHRKLLKKELIHTEIT